MRPVKYTNAKIKEGKRRAVQKDPQAVTREKKTCVKTQNGNYKSVRIIIDGRKPARAKK